MARRSKPVTDVLTTARPLPLSHRQWQEVVRAMGLSSRQAQIAELMLRDLSDKQIAAALKISESTLETHKQRICLRTGIRGRMQLAMHVLAVSHEVRK